MQGRLRGEHLSATIETECAHCGRRMEIALDSELHFQVRDGGPEPLVFEPEINWQAFKAPNIIDAY